MPDDIGDTVLADENLPYSSSERRRQTDYAIAVFFFVVGIALVESFEPDKGGWKVRSPVKLTGTGANPATAVGHGFCQRGF
ncbi:MAG: hypothetical protein KJT03_12890, partial [Verrucomicrobiae bacterium]|nr:hypothetical protein [Verrucomicrobiae bacterium]